MVAIAAGRGTPDGEDRRFDTWYAATVGLARRVLDRDGAALGASLPLAEEIATEALVRTGGAPDPADDGHSARLVAFVADATLEHLVGHPGSVPLHPELLGADIDFDGELPMAELQEALCDLRRRDRRVGLLVLGAGLRPVEAAALLGLSLTDTLRCLARVGTRLADGRRVRTPALHDEATA
jgi:hypothetical protein